MDHIMIIGQEDLLPVPKAQGIVSGNFFTGEKLVISSGEKLGSFKLQVFSPKGEIKFESPLHHGDCLQIDNPTGEYREEGYMPSIAINFQDVWKSELKDS